MKFTVSTADSWYDSDSIPRLEKLGFTFRKPLQRPYKLLAYDGSDVSDTIRAISDEVEVEINSLEELLAFIREYGRIVMEEDSILIYDTYIE